MTSTEQLLRHWVSELLGIMRIAAADIDNDKQAYAADRLHRCAAEFGGVFTASGGLDAVTPPDVRWKFSNGALVRVEPEVPSDA